MEMVKMVKTQTVGEEIANSISHGLGAGLSVAGLVLIIVKACYTSTATGIVGASIYGASLVLLYLTSCLYHALAKTRAREVFRVLDHCSIFILILGTYTPIAIWGIKGITGWSIFIINLICTVVGIVFNAIDLKKWEKVSVVLYVIMGWLIVFSFKSLLIFDKSGLVMLVLGGISYTVGIIFFALPKLKFFHFLWHIFVLFGSILHFFFVYFYVY